MIQEHGYTILNKIDEKYCIRESTTKKSLIDHVCSNLKDNAFHLAIINTPMSDLKQIFLEMKRYLEHEKKNSTMKQSTMTNYMKL